jgi:hypothetical protein
MAMFLVCGSFALPEKLFDIPLTKASYVYWNERCFSREKECDPRGAQDRADADSQVLSTRISTDINKALDLCLLGGLTV